MRFPFTLAIALACAAPLSADVVRVDVESRETVAVDYTAQPDIPYEKLTGTIHFAFDPENPANANICDLEFAPLTDGKVLASANFMVLRPVAGGSHTALLEVSNRGGKASLSYFNNARSSGNPVDAEHFGDAFLMRLGLTIIWVGWQCDVPEGDGRLRLEVPVASGPDGPLTGLVRSDWTLDRATDVLELGHRGHDPYPVLDPASEENVLTMRRGRMSERVVVPRKRWSVDESGTKLVASDEFAAGYIYEFVYRAQDPRMVGLGLAAIRDTMSYAKYDEESVFPVDFGMAVGISQTGRFLRHFLYQGFNTDEHRDRAFDGMLIHTAGAGRGSFNHRFAQPSRDAHRYSAFFYPTDLFPFSSSRQRDPLTKADARLYPHSQLERQHLPKVFYTNTGYEYWGRAASLLHTSLDGSADVAPLDNERIFHLAGAQHFVAGFPPRRAAEAGPVPHWRGNPLDFKPMERALLNALFRWVRHAEEPPRSVYPRIKYGTLVGIDEVRFPKIPGIEFPGVIHEAYRADYGPEWTEGIITKQPPELGPAFTSLVPQVDDVGNEFALARPVELAAPLATYTPWHVRSGMEGGNGELTDFYGTFIPFAATEAQRKERGDPRPSLAERYESREDFLNQTRRAASAMNTAGLLMLEDINAVVARAAEMWDWIQSL